MLRERDVPSVFGWANVYNSPCGKIFWFPHVGRYPSGEPSKALLADWHFKYPDIYPTNFASPAFIGREYISTQGRTRAETLGYRLGFPDEPDVVMKDCYHRSLKAINLPFSFIWRDPVSESYGYWYMFVRGRLPYFFSNWISEQNLILPSTDTVPCSRRAWYHLQPRFEGEISMLNFIFELKDFRDICKHALKITLSPGFSQMLRNFRKTLPDINQPTKTAAELNLANQFMLKPLISDLVAIGAMLLETVQAVQAQYAESGSSYQKKHYSEVLNMPAPLTPGEYNTSYYNWMEYGSQTKDLFTATLRYQYKYNVRNFWDAFSRYWGLRFTPEVVWNMIPFSFLIDYTIKIGQSLNALEPDPNTILTKYTYCESIKRSLVCGCVGRVDPRGKTTDFFLDQEYYEGGPEDRPVSGYFGNVYHRYVTAPARGQLYVPKTSWPKTQQAINMAALLRCFL